MKVLITSGNTLTPIDKVRVITNIFRGRTGAAIANYFESQGVEVTLLSSDVDFSKRMIGMEENPNRNIDIIGYKTYDDLYNLMEERVRNGAYDVIIHSAAVSDYEVDGTYCVQKRLVDDESDLYLCLDRLDSSGKIGSDHSELYLRMVPTEKIIDNLYDWGHTGLVVKFKLQVDMADEELLEIARASMLHSGSDFMVANCLKWSNERAYILDSKSDSCLSTPRADLPNQLYKAICGR